MKVLVDTSVWSLALRRNDSARLNPEELQLKARLVQAIQDSQASIIGLIRQELLSSIKDEAQFEKLKNALDVFLDEPLDTSDFVHAAKLYNACRKRGFEAGTVDMLICAVAARRHWEILTNDGRLKRCFEIATSVEQKTQAAPAIPAKSERHPSRNRKT